MATMIKEKRREKKKNKEKHTSEVQTFQNLETECYIKLKDQEIVQEGIVPLSHGNVAENISGRESLKTGESSSVFKENEVALFSQNENTQEDKPIEEVANLMQSENIENFEDTACEQENSGNTQVCNIPYAPAFEEETTEENEIPAAYNIEEEVPIDKVNLKVQCMSIEAAVGNFGGTEICEVKAISKKEESVVEVGPVSGPEHPLVDLLLSFRSSLNAVEHARVSISQGFLQEEKSRAALWKVEKRKVFLDQECPPCAKTVFLSVTYDWATLQIEKIPTSRMCLESLNREVQDSYCHHQHSALLAYSQIEELVYETMQSGKAEIREALSLVLQALKLSDDYSEAYSKALQRWAILLSASLLHGKDIRQLIFLIHHLFRQTRSVRWAAQVIRLQVIDLSDVARLTGLLELLLARPGLETAVECTEELGELWEEVGKGGDSSAVSEGRLRERDALALLKTFPLRQMLAKLALFSRSDISSTRENEWGDSSGGYGVLKVACGVRVLLDVVRRAMCAHAQYMRLNRALRVVCECALHNLAALHVRSRAFYHEYIYNKLLAELEAAFVSGLEMFSAGDLHRLPAALLSEDVAKDYCVGIMLALHDYSPHRVASLDAQLPALRCDVGVRVIVQAAHDRVDDSELARIILEYLCKTAVKLRQLSCKNLCCMEARKGLQRLLAVHPYLHCTSLHVLADLNQADPVDPSSVSYLAVHEWRPNTAEALGVLEDWSLRCPQLIEHLLLQLNYRPHHGISLETQLAIGSWLCEHEGRLRGETAEWAWLVLQRLCVHRTCWSGPLDAPAPHQEPRDLLSTVYALLSTAWGHSIPLICSVGARALCQVARARPQEAVHCLGVIMRVMQHSPESVALTAEFTEVFSILLGAGPSLMARVLGRGGPSGAELLEHMFLNQLTELPYCSGALNPWLRGLWAPELPSAARALLDAGLRASRDWPALDATVSSMLQGENRKELLSDAVRNAAVAPLLCEASLRGTHAHFEAVGRVWLRLLDALAQQRAAGQRIHVDNALKQIAATISADELVVYRVATAALVAPLQNPAHLMLWRLFFHLYLQRPPSKPQNTTAPVGPLFFNGIIKSRLLSQLKKRLQDTIHYHHARSEQLQPIVSTVQTQQIATSSAITKTKVMFDDNLFPSISINNLTGQLSDSDTESDTSDDESTEDATPDGARESAVTSQENVHLYCYHVAAAKLMREYSRWLNEGDKVRVVPHHADFARFIPEQGLNAAWRNSLPSWCYTSTSPRPSATRPPPKTHLQIAIDNLLKIRDNSSTRPRVPQIKSLLGDQNNLSDARTVFNLVDKYLREFEALAKDWSDDVKRLSKLDEALWGLERALRVRRPLPSYTKSCINRCPPLTFHLQRDEWVISTGVQQGIEENRRSALTVLRRLARPRPDAAKIAATLQTLARCVRSNETARRVAERAGRSADAVGGFSPAMDAITLLVTLLAERWLCGDAQGCGELVRSWGAGNKSRRALCSVLVAPRMLSTAAFFQLYESLITAPLPAHALFSYLSRFEMSSWADKVDSALREKMLDVLIQAAQRRGKSNQPEDNVLLELIGVHVRAVCRVGEVCGLILQSVLASTSGELPSELCAHVTHTAAYAHELNYNQLGNLLRTLGKYWWEARTSLIAESDAYEPYAAHTAHLLQTLQRAFVAATKALGHDIEKVSWFSWSALSEAWAPWVHPAHPWPLLPITHAEVHAGDTHAHANMLQSFVETLQLVMEDCPGSEEYILRYVWEWTVHTYFTVSTPVASQASRVQMSALLAALEALAWTRAQWMLASCMSLVMQVSRSTDKEITTWCCLTWRNTAAGTWLNGVPNEQLAPHLANLLSVFCSAQLQIDSQALDEATRLPWYRLPEPALDAAFEQFFVDHHNPALPYHEIPQFRVLLAASQLLVVDGSACCDAAVRSHRARSVSQCIRAAAAPSLLAHARAHILALLRTLSDLAPHIESSEGEIEELLSRAIVIMCLEPADAVLPVWEQWVQKCSARLVLACASAVASLTVLEYFVPLAEAVAKTLISYPDNKYGGWEALRERWALCAWGSHAACAAAGARRSWHAAYALLPAGGARAPAEVLRALSALDLGISHDDPIMAVWVCVACRIGKQQVAPSIEGAPPDQELVDAVQSARSLLCRWAAEPRRSLLQVVAMQQNSEAARIRLLCRLAKCILNPSPETNRAFESSCGALFHPTNADIASWGKAPRPHHLPRLAATLYLNKDAYFKEELEITSVDT